MSLTERIAGYGEYRLRARCCYVIACKMATHADAAKFAIEKGYADDLADFDQKVYCVEEGYY